MLINNKRTLDGTTGYDHIDKLSMEDRLRLIEQRKQFQQSLAPERRTQLWERYYEIIREKKKEYIGRLSGEPDEEILQKYFNEDVPRQLESMVKKLEEEGNQIIDPVEQAEYREYAEDLIAPLLPMYKYREEEEKVEE